MADLLKYDMTDVWAVAGDVVAPDSAKIRAGWGVEVVPRQWWNWFENRQDNNIAYMLQKGFPEWDATTEYIINKSYVQRNGVVYRATATSTNSDPIALTSWVKAFPNSTAASEALSTVTPAANTMPYFTNGVTASTTALTAFGRSIAALVDAAAARTLFSAQLADTNLTALSGVTANTNILPYFTSTTAMTGTTLTAFARTLLDDADATASRATLGLGTAATANVTTSALDQTAGRLVKVGDYGENGGTPIQQVNTVNADNLTGALHVFPNGGINLPTASTYYVKHIPYPAVGYAKQIAWGVVVNSEYTRTQVGGAWSAWTESWTTDNLIKTTSNRDKTAGRMIKVGDFGLGVAVVLTDADDLNTVVDAGFYRLSGGNPNLPNFSGPVGGFGQMIVSRGQDTVAQMVFAFNGNRIFTRAGNPSQVGGSGAWSAWVELYHTGNSATLVAQVTAGIQPTLDAKVNKAGDIMTGQLAAQTLYATGNGSSVGGQVYFKSLSSTAPGGADATISIDSPTPSTNNAGRLVLTAATTYVQSALTVTGNASFQGSVAASGQVSGSSIATAGNINCLNITASNSMLIQGASTALTVTNSASFAGGVVRLNNGGVSIQPTAMVGSNASVLSFYDTTSTVLRGAIYGSSANQVVIQTGTAQSAIICDAAGNSSMKSVLLNALTASGRVAGNDLLSLTHLYMNNGNSYVDSGGNVYGSTWGGLLSSFLAATYTQRGNIGADMAAVNVQGLGVYAFLQNNTGANMGIGSTAASGLTYSSHNNVSGTTAPGTWRSMGWANTGGVSVFQRIA